MNDDLRNEIYSNMNLKETDELIDIWEQHNLDEWTDVAFDVIEEILRDRLGELPSPGELNEEMKERELVEKMTMENTMAEQQQGEEGIGKDIVCPNCKGKNLLRRNPQTSGSGRRIVLKKPIKVNLTDLLEEDEIVAIACKDCGFVFFMLKGYV